MGIWCRTAGTIQCTAAPPRRGCPEGVPPSDGVGEGPAPRSRPAPMRGARCPPDPASGGTRCRRYDELCPQFRERITVEGGAALIPVVRSHTLRYL